MQTYFVLGVGRNKTNNGRRTFIFSRYRVRVVGNDFGNINGKKLTRAPARPFVTAKNNDTNTVSPKLFEGVRGGRTQQRQQHTTRTCVVRKAERSIIISNFVYLFPGDWPVGDNVIGCSVWGEFEWSRRTVISRLLYNILGASAYALHPPATRAQPYGRRTRARTPRQSSASSPAYSPLARVPPVGFRRRLIRVRTRVFLRNKEAKKKKIGQPTVYLDDSRPWCVGPIVVRKFHVVVT